MRKRDAYIDDDDYVVPDGGSVRTRMVLMDSARFAFDAANHRPGYRSATDSAVRDAQMAALDARDAMIERATTAWRKRRRRKEDDGDDDDEVLGSEGQNRTDPDQIGESALDARTASYDAMCVRLATAWRTPGRDAAEPDAAAELLPRRRLRADPDDDVAPDPGDIGA